MKIKSITEINKDGIAALIFASPKIGKTSSLAHLPGKTLLIDVDKGCRVLSTSASNKPNIDIVHLGKDVTIDSVLSELEEGKLDYNNVVIDSITEFDKSYLSFLGKEGKSKYGVPERNHYLAVNYMLLDLARRFRNLTTLGINAIMTAWEELDEIVMSDGTKITVIKPLLRKSITSNICGLQDIIGRLEVSSKDNVTRYFRFAGSSTMYTGDRIFKREYCAVDELICPKPKTNKKEN